MAKSWHSCCFYGIKLDSRKLGGLRISIQGLFIRLRFWIRGRGSSRILLGNPLTVFKKSTKIGHFPFAILIRQWLRLGRKYTIALRLVIGLAAESKTLSMKLEIKRNIYSWAVRRAKAKYVVRRAICNVWWDVGCIRLLHYRTLAMTLHTRFNGFDNMKNYLNRSSLTQARNITTPHICVQAKKFS